MIFPTTFSHLLSDRGIPMMEALGTADVALTAEDALDAAEVLVGTGVAILGGDVFYKTAEGFKLAYANWHTDPKAGEDAGAYATRSIQETRDYIRRYPVVPEKTALFALVVAQVF
jgi:hypothetical protein